MKRTNARIACRTCGSDWGDAQAATLCERRHSRPYDYSIHRIQQPDPRTASDWLMRALATAEDRDPVDAANDAEYLAALLAQRAADVHEECRTRELEAEGLTRGDAQGCAEAEARDGHWFLKRGAK